VFRRLSVCTLLAMSGSEITIRGLEWVRGQEEPFDASSTLGLIEWEHLALNEREVFAADLRALGLSEPMVAETLEFRDGEADQISEVIKTFWDRQPRRYLTTPPELQAEATLVFDSARMTARQRLRDWWNSRVTTVEQREPIELRFPLFVMGAPSVDECKAEWMGEAAYGGMVGWSVTVAGTGLGKDGRATASTSSTFEATSGQTKLIFLPITVQLEQIAINEPGQHSIRRWQIDVAGMSESHRSPGVLLLPPDAVPPRGVLVDTYPLAGDPTASTATYQRKYVQSSVRHLNVGIKARGVDLGLSAESTMTSTVALKYTLRSGVDYELYEAAVGDGLLFA